MMRRISKLGAALLASTAGATLLLGQAQASQGPGVMPGTANTTLQLAMAVIVYGGSALLVAAGVIGAARQRRTRI